MNTIHYTYKDCSPEDFAHDTSFSETEFDELLEPVFDLSINISMVRVVFSKVQSKHRFQVHIEAVINGRSDDTVLDGPEEPSKIVKAAIRQFIKKMRDIKERVTHK